MFQQVAFESLGPMNEDTRATWVEEFPVFQAVLETCFLFRRISVFFYVVSISYKTLLFMTTAQRFRLSSFSYFLTPVFTRKTRNLAIINRSPVGCAYSSNEMNFKGHSRSSEMSRFDRSLHNNYVLILYRFPHIARYWSKIVKFVCPRVFCAPSEFR